MSLLWYYRPEHLDCGRRPFDTPDEIYASRHRDHTSVACIEDKCYVMTFNEYCRYVQCCKSKLSKFQYVQCQKYKESFLEFFFCFRYRKFVKMLDDGATSHPSSIVPDPKDGYERANLLPKCRVAPDRVFLCRRVYDSRMRRLFKNPA